MRILFPIHLYVPQHGAGGELYIHNLAKYMISKGHQCRVLHYDAAKYGIDDLYTYEGVEVFPPFNNQKVLYSWADIVITHLGYASQALCICNTEMVAKPAVFVSHNTWTYDIVMQQPWVKVLYNSNAMKAILKYPNDSFVLHPVSDYRFYDDEENHFSKRYITLVNTNKNKGAKIFFNIARAMPERDFLAVKGGYDPQYSDNLPNLKFIDNTIDMRDVYRQTRILLVPSKYESWGMCATEAMCSGIPVIYSPTFGLDENVGDYGIRIKDPDPAWVDIEIAEGENQGIDPSNYKQWVKAIKQLDNPNNYKKYAKLSRERSRQLDPQKELYGLEEFLKKAIRDYAEIIASRHIFG